MTDFGLSLLIIFSKILFIRGCFTHQGGCRDQEYFQSIPDKALIGHVIENKTVETPQQCRIQCYMEPRCVSTNFDQNPTNSANCQLSSSEAETHPHSLVYKPGMFYKGTKNNCRNITCPLQMECHSGYELQGYQCTYPDKCCKVLNKRVLYFPRKSVEDYINLTTSFNTNLTAFTLCLMAQFQCIEVGHEVVPFSLASETKINNLGIFMNNNNFYLYVSDKNIKVQIALDDGKWHHICATWESSSGNWQVYIDGHMRGKGSNLAAGQTITNGIAIVGQDQDNLGGKFQQKQSFVGHLTSMSLWDRVLSPYNGSLSFLINYECHPQLGQVLGWEDMLKGKWHGTIKEIQG